MATQHISDAVLTQEAIRKQVARRDHLLWLLAESIANRQAADNWLDIDTTEALQRSAYRALREADQRGKLAGF